MALETQDNLGEVVQKLRYGYDAAGNVTKLWDDHGVLGEESWTFSYDTLDRLTGMSGSDWRNYGYDAIGNLRSKAGVTYGYPESGVDSIRPHAVISTTAGGSFTYDANGNMAVRTEGGVTFLQTWDYENRLTSVTNQATGETTTFTYDANGDLVKASDGCQTTYYHGDLYEEQHPGGTRETTPVTVPDAGFEEVDDWDLVGYPEWPATSFYTDTLGTGIGRGGGRGLAVSNHASGNIYSDLINATAGTTYELKAWIRGDTFASLSAGLDPDDSAGCWTLRLFYFGQSGYLGEGIAASGCGGLAETERQEVGAESALTTPPGTSEAKVAFYAFMNSGWLAVDDLSLKVEGQGANLLPNMGFESAATWTFVAEPRFPGTSVWRNTWGTAEGRGGPGTYAVAISNHAYGLLMSERRAVTPGQQYDLHAWVRGGRQSTGMPSWTPTTAIASGGCGPSTTTPATMR